MLDSASRPYAAIYAASDAVPMVVGMVTTARGDVAELVDETGAAFALYRTDAFGAPVEVSSCAAGSVPATLAAAIAARNPVRYAGYCFDEHSQLYYLSQRYYDPASRQFLSKDPARADGEESAYQYCGGDPVGKVDPSGRTFIQFNGRQLTIFFTFTYAAYPAITGPPSTGWSQTDGPIPPGSYTIYAWSIKDAAGGWGSHKIRLYPTRGTSLYGRFGFHLHAGYWRNTIGCIRTTEAGLMRVIGELQSRMRMTVRVNYPSGFGFHK